MGCHGAVPLYRAAESDANAVDGASSSVPFRVSFGWRLWRLGRIGAGCTDLFLTFSRATWPRVELPGANFLPVLSHPDPSVLLPLSSRRRFCCFLESSVYRTCLSFLLRHLPNHRHVSKREKMNPVAIYCSICFLTDWVLSLRAQLGAKFLRFYALKSMSPHYSPFFVFVFFSPFFHFLRFPHPWLLQEYHR